MMISVILKTLHQRPIAHYPIHTQICGSTTAGVALSQIMYWLSKKDAIYKTDKEIIEETLLTEREWKTAKSIIRKFDFFTINLQGLPAKTVYKIDWEKYAQYIENFQSSLDESAQQDGTNQPNNVGQNVPKDGTNQPNNVGQNVLTLYKDTENTTENTTEIEKDKKKKYFLEKFYDFHKRYAGVKRGRETEYKNLVKKHKDHEQVIPLLEYIDVSFPCTEKKYIPHFQTFINQRRWEQENPKTELEQQEYPE